MAVTCLMGLPEAPAQHCSQGPWLQCGAARVQLHTGLFHCSPCLTSTSGNALTLLLTAWSPLKISSKSIPQGYPRFFSLQFLTVTIQSVCGKMFNKLLCRKSSTHLRPPPSSSGISHADSFANFFTDKISQLRISLTSNISTLYASSKDGFIPTSPI